MKFSILLTASLMVVFAATPRTQSHDVRFRAAQQKEDAQGDLRGAIALYRQLAEDRTTPPEIAAKAMLQIGRCYERLGNSELSEARKAYERVLAQYPAQGAAAAEAKARLAALRPKPAGAAVGVSVHKVLGIDGALSSTISEDGRVAAVLKGPMAFSRSRIEIVDLGTGRGQPLAVASALEMGSGLAVSPDGRLVAIGTSARASELRLVDRNAVSPDGRLVAIGTSARPSELRLVDRNAQKMRTLMTSSTASLAPLDWARDGRTILVVAGPERSLHVADVETAQVQDVAEVRAAAEARFSPDGKFIAYTVQIASFRPGPRPPNGVYVTRLAGGPGALIAEQERVRLAGWSEDGKYVLFAAPDADGDQLWGMRVEAGRPSGRPVSLAKIPPSASYHGMRSGSLMIVMPGVPKLYVAAIDPVRGEAQAPEQVIGKVDGLFADLAYSPDGTQLAYVVSRERGVDRVHEFHVRDLRSGTERRVGTFLGSAGLRWTPDGSSLIFTVLSDVQSGPTAVRSRIVRISAADRRTEDLVPDDGEVSMKLQPHMTHDGSTLYYLSAKLGQGPLVDLIRYDIATKTGQAIATSSVALFGLSPDERHLVVTHREPGSPLLTIMTPDGQRVREIARADPHHQIVALSWAPDGKWIYFVRAAEDGYTVHRVPAVSGAPAFTGLRLPRNVFDLDVHPNGGQIAFTTLTARELWRVDNIRVPSPPTTARR